MYALKRSTHEGVCLSTVTMAVFGIAFLISHQGCAVAYNFMEAATMLCPESHFCTESNFNSQKLRRGVSDADPNLPTTDITTIRPGSFSSDIAVSNGSTASTTPSSTRVNPSAASFDDSDITNAAITESTFNPVTSSKTSSFAIPNTDFNIGDLIPCCHPCSCDPDCQQSGSCCPDTEQRSKTENIPKTENIRKEENMAPANCLRPVLNNFVPNLSDDLPWYKIISRCPTDYKVDITIDKCSTAVEHINPDLNIDDVVIVSDGEDPDRIFINRHCAACNNVTNMTRWTIKVVGTCFPTDLGNFEATAFSAINYLIYNCPIVFEPHDIHLSAHAACNTNIVRTCNVTGQWDAYDSQIEEACSSSYIPYLDPYVADDPQERYTQYKNVFCFLCNQHAGVSRPNVCSRRQLGIATRTYPTNTSTVVLDPLVFINRTVAGPCYMGGWERDPITKKCKPFHCGIYQYPQNNRCIRLFKQAYGLVLEMHLMLKPTVDVMCSHNISQLSSEDQLKFQQWLLQTIGIAACYVSDLTVTVYWQEDFMTDTDVLKAIVIVADINTNIQCTTQDIDGALLRISNNGSSFPVSLDGYFIDLEENIELSATVIETGWQAPELDNNAIMIVQMNRGNSLKIRLTSRFYCPYFVLPYVDYCAFSGLIGIPCPNMTLRSSDFALMPGFSLISTDNLHFFVVVCKQFLMDVYSSLHKVPSPPTTTTTTTTTTTSTVWLNSTHILGIRHTSIRDEPETTVAGDSVLVTAPVGNNAELLNTQVSVSLLMTCAITNVYIYLLPLYPLSFNLIL